ncbi:RNA polymerase sigma factor [Paenibacillus mucilaginosus]|uniref:ECF subfamily RNA polymerase sigma-24 subunit n=2 Tax=Paenibacillus mucilaginosus TaxID=61624 RepID=H6NBT5_9BACL|nr:sigma-70 family RNA polymerase sigma factor [Paenibacillus mucilaginosus]AEI42074.1 RNA polymerase, sigma-24 subunit, ECF subfamily [Paenibacillus mucilaginosus KNP414]AFC27886.1 ECF subfamily RNA polymerase sigma-24 subunit [Paenibacillus mucilaginosus 3016]MCG7214061.1 sigma-70 family RNA polymerase sigma factor [Paenibacillus mucilaginosus]WDM28585.1 sigma-70 family RNA polymerase sigma factor [Paenibacillus mucilaginosus]WFA16750.1 sigma-70 family RNA polymerase sigma factor [Paenibacil
MYGTLTDQELIERITARDEEALTMLYDRYEKAVYAFAYRMVQDPMMAEEVVQELFLRIWNAAARYDSGQGKLTTWMFTLTRNITIDALRKKRRRSPQQPAEPEALAFVADDRADTEGEVESRWVGEEIQAALQVLNQDQKQVLEWIYYQGYTQQEVSERYAIPLGTVKSRVRLALKQLQQRLSHIGRREIGHD